MCQKFLNKSNALSNIYDIDFLDSAVFPLYGESAYTIDEEIKAAFETMTNNCLAYYADLNGGYENSATLRFCVESAIECIEASLTELTACLAEY